MTSIRQSAWAAFLVLSAVTASAQTTRPSKQYTIDQFLNTHIHFRGVVLR